MSERVLITVGDGGTPDEVAALLEAAGARVEKVLAAVGVIVAVVDPDRRSALAALPGVGAVEPDREVRLRPPDVQ